ncbi:MAG: hypothetical protein ACREHE_08845 [Rhizomicrobium sp.]
MSFRLFFGVAAAFVVAAAAPSAAIFFVGLIDSGRTALGLAVIVFIVALLHALVFGLPAYHFGALFQRINIWTCTLIGFAIGALPSSFDALSSALTQSSQPESRVNFWILPGLVLIMGSLGALGGFAFWAVLRSLGLLAIVNTLPGYARKADAPVK